ncbi:MAG: TonB-dependent receptor [Planctomycetes bacterium]|nr:TonB-dependent receptor [Planctomycetota bacterium]
MRTKCQKFKVLYFILPLMILVCLPESLKAQEIPETDEQVAQQESTEEQVAENLEQSAEEQVSEEDDLLSMSFEDLLEIPVVVSASKYEQPIDRSPTAINILTSEDIERSGAKTIADLLRRFPGVWSWTKTRSDFDVGLMGLLEDDNPRALYLLDGQPISTPMFDGMQWPQFPITLEEVERIEIVRGGGSAIYGANALTGVINIITKSTKYRKNVLNSYIGEKGIHNHTLTLARTFEKLSFSVTGGWRQTEKQATFDPTFNLGDQDYFRTPVLNTKIEYEIADNQQATFFGGYSVGDGGYPASPGDRSVDLVKNWENIYISGNYSNALSDETDLTFKGAFHRIDQRNFKPYQPGSPEKYNVHGERYNLEAHLVSRIIPRNTILAGATYQYTMANSVGEISNLSPSRKQGHQLIGTFFQDEYDLMDEISLIGSMRYDCYDDMDDEFTARGTMMYYLNEKNIFRFSTGRSYRSSDIYNRHYIVTWPGGYFKGSADLPAQIVKSYELEYRTHLIEKHTLKIEAFQSKLEDAYFNDFIGPGPQIEKSTTDHDYIIRGLIGEIEGVPVQDVINWYANFTLFDAEDDTSGLEMADVPEFMLNAGVRYYPIEQVYLSVDAHYQDGFGAISDSSVTDSVNGIPGGTSVNSFTTVDLKVGSFPWENVEVSVSIENLFNDQHFEFPLHLERGRTLYAGVRIYW